MRMQNWIEGILSKQHETRLHEWALRLRKSLCFSLEPGSQENLHMLFPKV